MTPADVYRWLVCGIVVVVAVVATIWVLALVERRLFPDGPSQYDRCLAAGASYEEDGNDVECIQPGTPR